MLTQQQLSCLQAAVLGDILNWQVHGHTTSRLLCVPDLHRAVCYRAEQWRSRGFHRGSSTHLPAPPVLVAAAGATQCAAKATSNNEKSTLYILTIFFYFRWKQRPKQSDRTEIVRRIACQQESNLRDLSCTKQQNIPRAKCAVESRTPCASPRLYSPSTGPVTRQCRRAAYPQPMTQLP
jgi:hypothetical protein